MNAEQLEEELNKTLPEYKIARANFNRLERKIELLEKALYSLRQYSEGELFNFAKTNTLTHFLNSGLVTLDPKLYCRQKVFLAAFNDHCRENHFVSSKWTKQFYDETFTNFGITVVENVRKRYPNELGSKSYTETFIMGVDVRNMDGEYESDESE